MTRLATILLVASALLGHAAETVGGRWEGLVQIPGRELKVIIDLAESTRGTWVGSITIPELDIKGTPLTDIVVTDSEAIFTIKNALTAPQAGQASFKAHLTATGTLAGDFLQAGNTAPFVLEKTGPPQVELPERSTAIAMELEGEWKGDYELTGYARHVTITLVNHGADGATAQFVVVGKRTTNVPVDIVSQEGEFLRIESRELAINYEGRFHKEAGEIRGTFEQGPFELPLVLHRSR